MDRRGGKKTCFNAHLGHNLRIKARSAEFDGQVGKMLCPKVVVLVFIVSALESQHGLSVSGRRSGALTANGLIALGYTEVTCKAIVKSADCRIDIGQVCLNFS